MLNRQFLKYVGLMFFFSSICQLQFVYAESPKLCCKSGCMIGKYMTGIKAEKFMAFLGIPYAEPPLGKLRFSNPRPYTSWPGILNATEPKMDCIQKNYILPHAQIYGVEDCLYLNVYRPIVFTNKLLPVMVYIHGGGWFSGSASPLLHGPEYFMDTKEVILVTFAYRLGPLGFLSTYDGNISGNFGLKDQNLALRWVQQNIKNFGGNPKLVTLFGQSAGAISAHMHMLSKQSEGLFQRVISLSGTSNVPFAINNNPLMQARKVAELCNITGANQMNTFKLTRALRNVDVETLVKSGDGLKYWDVDHMTNFRPVVEKYSSGAFFTVHPKNLLKNGVYRKVPWMVGLVPHEGAVRVLSILENEQLKTSFNENFDELFEKLMELPEKFNSIQRHLKTKRIIDEYFNGQHELNNETAQGFLDTVTDRGFYHPFFNAIKHFVHTTNKYQEAKIYLYKFSYQGSYSFANLYTGHSTAKNYGVVHCDDLIYLFRAPLLFPDFKKDSTERKMIDHFVNNFIHFAKFGKPLNATELKPCNKLSFNDENETICDYREFVNDATNSFKIKTENKFNVRRMKMWNDILEDPFNLI